MIQTIHGGGKIDAATPAEMRQMFAEQAQIESDRDRERLRGIKDLQRSVLISSPAQTHITINDGVTPSAGTKWVIRLVGIYLASAGTGQAFITSDTTSTLGGVTQAKPVGAFATSAAYQVATYGNGALVLDEGEGLYLNFTQNVAGYIMTGWITTAEKIGRFS